MTAGPGPAPRPVPVAGAAEVPPGTMLMVQVDGTNILLVNLDGVVRAMQGTCSHEYFELDKGFITGDSITCALHMSRFDVASGEALDPPAEMPLRTYPVTVVDGRIVLELPEGQVPVNEEAASPGRTVRTAVCPARADEVTPRRAVYGVSVRRWVPARSTAACVNGSGTSVSLSQSPIRSP